MQQDPTIPPTTASELTVAQAEALDLAEGSPPVAAPEGEAESAAPGAKLPEIPVAEIATVTCQEDLVAVLKAHEFWTYGVLDPRVAAPAGRANLRGADLRGYSLQGVNLAGATLAGANLAECNLSGANLSAADLTGAILACADLTCAKLRGARIDGADMRGANLTGAFLGKLDLSRAILRSAEAAPSPPAADTPPPLAEVATAIAAPVPDNSAVDVLL